MAVSTIIYSNGGFSLKGDDSPGCCGTQSEPELPLTGSAIEGKHLFQENCASCHTMNKELTGPALMGSDDRVPSKHFVEDLLWYPEKTIRKNAYAKALYDKYGHLMHMSFLNILSKKDIETIENYCRAYVEPVALKVEAVD